MTAEIPKNFISMFSVDCLFGGVCFDVEFMKIEFNSTLYFYYVDLSNIFCAIVNARLLTLTPFLDSFGHLSNISYFNLLLQGFPVPLSLN
jgi:hypothetical protein